MKDQRTSRKPRRPDFEAIEAKHYEEITKNLKTGGTKVHQRKAENVRRAAEVKYQFGVDCRTEGTVAYDDPVWNPLHPLHDAVNGLIDSGLATEAAIAEAFGNGVDHYQEAAKEKAEAEAKEKADLEDLANWLADQTWSDFAVSLADQYRTKGSLSPKQINAAKSMRSKVEARQKAREEDQKAEAADGPIDLTELPSGYYAVPNGETRLKVRVSRSGPRSKWHGWTWVDDGAAYGSRTSYGRQGPNEGDTYKGKIRNQLRAIMADPFEAQVAYGKLTGTCGACGRLLEDKESIRKGIGPICEAKWTQ